ncbi:WYL domain-containing protein [Alkalicoccobacillus murimartini]|uniref:DNA-binding transcriptional regulator YafY n=1 Tax=Alkalicoccobacillus murimartini TaxID=171685 RepID=A0ABT9YE02_9BACI|nr:hypothetical protein [Alkalicoccobacillus murimartini]MDQ0205259.1 putative DNA-binding transcriptional regulator YafY [Alkalicoccobacillus murimartini]
MFTSFLTKSCLQKNLIELIYLSKSNQMTHRIITADKLSNGLLTGYCHQRKQIRRFSVDRILSVLPVQQKEA